jgi:hypothetical protein
MKTIKLSRDEELALREVIRLASKHLDMGEGQKYLDSIQIQIERAPDDTIDYMEIVKKCEDCGASMITTDLITKGDHHGGTKTVCRDRHLCHSRSDYGYRCS